MSLHRRAARRDSNEVQIVDALRAAGYTVQRLSEKGCPDLLVGGRGVNVLMEVKTGPAHKLTPDETAWHADWRGQVAVVYDDVDALNVMDAATRVLV